MPRYANKEYRLGRGSVYFDPFDATQLAAGTPVLTGEIPFGNAPAFSFEVAAEKLEHFSSESPIGEKDASVITQINRTSTLQIDNINDENIGLFVAGNLAEYTQPNAPVSGEAFDDVVVGRWYQLGSTVTPAGVQNVTAVTLAGLAVDDGVIADPDYKLDELNGRFQLLEGGAAGVVDGDTVTAGYTPADETRNQITLGSAVDLRGALRFIENNAKGRNRVWYFPDVLLSPSGAIEMISANNWSTASFSVDINKLDDDTAPAYIDGRAIQAP